MKTKFQKQKEWTTQDTESKEQHPLKEIPKPDILSTKVCDRLFMEKNWVKHTAKPNDAQSNKRKMNKSKQTNLSVITK